MPVKFLLVNAVDNKKPIEEHHPALGLGYVVSSLREAFGDKITCKIINKELASHIKDFNPDIIGITSVSKNYNLAKEYARTAKQAGLPVLIGGVHVYFMPQTMTSDMDIAIEGEGEGTIVDLFASFMEEGTLNKSYLEDIPGILFRNNGELIKTPPRDLIKPLESIPYPARDLLDIQKSAHMLSSRGCPYHCAFCSTARYTRNQVRYAAPEYVVDEIELLYKNYGVEYITIYDDMFAMDSKRVIEIQKMLGQRKLIGKFGIAVNLRSNYVTDELAEILSQMNVKVVALGAESACQQTLEYLKGGGLTVEDNSRAVRILKKHHIIPYCSFILGSPNEDWDSVVQTINFIKNEGLYYYDIVILTPFPGTPIWDFALSKGLVSDDMDWSKLDFTFTSDHFMLSEKVGLKELAAVHRQMELRKQRYLSRLNLLLAIRHPIKTIREKINHE